MSKRLSRYVRSTDAKRDHLVMPLHPQWWSRPFEYEWATQFVKPHHVVLDAACGISHPFKFWLADHAREVHVCDLDPRIVSEEAIRYDVMNDFGSEAAAMLPEACIAKLKRECADIVKMPYKDGTFDRVFCISVMEHLDAATRHKALIELRRVLKPNGQIVLTFDVPNLLPEAFASSLAALGLRPLDAIDTAKPEDAITSSMWGSPLFCFRAVLEKTDLPSTSRSEKNEVESFKANATLVAGPVRQSPGVLGLFLASLERIRNVDIVLFDDNEDAQSVELLQQFASKHPSCMIWKNDKPRGAYVRTDYTHEWNDALVKRVADMKNTILDHARKQGYEHVLLVDSDVLVDQDAVSRLAAANKDIVSNIFWTSWQPNTRSMPQVWQHDLYGMDDGFMDKLQAPGIYEVGGLGACTLISKNALVKGVSFDRLHNVSFWGEDRHFCIRAVALGLSLWVDTHQPAFHVYREGDVAEGRAFLGRSCAQKDPAPQRAQRSRPRRLVLSMIVKNEADRYLREVLTDARQYVDQVVLIDDASTDGTVELCRELLENVQHVIVPNKDSLFGEEHRLRKQQWELAMQHEPDWLLCLDADEQFEPAFADRIESLLRQTTHDAFYFRLFDMWSATHYRDDQLWGAHHTYRPFLVRASKLQSVSVTWRESNQHCGRWPLEVASLAYARDEMRLKHLGWANAQDRKLKFERYRRLDPKGLFGDQKQYDSIMDLDPNLRLWEDARAGA